MVDRRMRNVVWGVSDDKGRAKSLEHVKIAILMDIRDELRDINRKLDCRNVVGGLVAMQFASESLRKIDRRLAKKIPLKRKSLSSERSHESGNT